MLDELVRQSELKAVPFSDEFKHLTYGQLILLKMMNDHINSNMPITTEDIKSCYFDAFKGKFLRTIYNDNGYGRNTYILPPKHEFMTNSYNKTTSINWFMRNIGACIIKGKLLVIPIIETA